MSYKTLYIYKKKNTNLINNQLEGFFVFHLVLKHNLFLAFSHQTPKAITTFTESITFYLNIKTIINHHSKKNQALFLGIVNSYGLRLERTTKLELGRCY